MSIFIYGQLPALTEKRIFSAGIDNRYRIIQQIAKQRGKVIVCNKIRCPTSYVGMKRYMAVSASLHIAA